MADEQQTGGLSRPDLLRAGAVVGVGAAAGGVASAEATAAGQGQGVSLERLILTNGRQPPASLVDDDMRRTQPVLSVIGGTVVHDTGAIQVTS